MPETTSIVFLLDVDNTLLDNDQLKDDLAADIRRAAGSSVAERFWELYEQVRQERDYVDYARTLELLEESGAGSVAVAQIRRLLDSLDFKCYLYPGALATIHYLNSLGTTVILSDGDSVFQPRKIRDSGLEAAVRGRVLIYIHKELEIPQIFARYPADHYVLIDDKPRILATLQRCCPTEFTTVLVCQGKYAARATDFQPLPDCVVPTIGAVQSLTRQQFLLGCSSDAKKPE